MSRRPFRRTCFVSAVLPICCIVCLAAGCARGTHQVAQTDESQGQAVSSSESNLKTPRDASTELELGDYENDPDYTPYVEDYTDGRRKLDGGFRNGKRHGVWTYYRSFNGSILRVERYRDGELLSME